LDTGTIVTVIVALGAALGGFVGGKRRSNTAAVETAVGVVELLQVRIETLETGNSEKAETITDLRVRIEVLESLVTQRADVEAVASEVAGVRGVVDRIADKMGA